MGSDHPTLLLSTATIMPVGPGNGPPDGVYRLESRGEPVPVGVSGRGGVLAPVVVDAGEPIRWYAATRGAGVWRTDDAGATWVPSDAGLTYREVWSLAQHPVTAQLVAGTGPAALFISTDRGETWRGLPSLLALPERRAWEFPGPPFHAHVKGIGLVADDPDVIFGAVEEGGVLRSRDGGRSWVNLRDGVEFDCHSVTVGAEPGAVLVTAGTGVYRSVDGGDTFSPSHDGITTRYMTPLWTHSKRPGALIVGGAQVPPPMWRRPAGAAGAVYRSEDGGLTWRRLRTGLPEPLVPAPLSLAADPDEPETVYMGLSDGSVWLSRDAGEGFRALARGLPPVYGITILAS